MGLGGFSNNKQRLASSGSAPISECKICHESILADQVRIWASGTICKATIRPGTEALKAAIDPAGDFGDPLNVTLEHLIGLVHLTCAEQFRIRTVGAPTMGGQTKIRAPRP